MTLLQKYGLSNLQLTIQNYVGKTVLVNYKRGYTVGKLIFDKDTGYKIETVASCKGQYSTSWTVRESVLRFAANEIVSCTVSSKKHYAATIELS